MHRVRPEFDDRLPTIRESLTIKSSIFLGFFDTTVEAVEEIVRRSNTLLRGCFEHRAFTKIHRRIKAHTLIIYSSNSLIDTHGATYIFNRFKDLAQENPATLEALENRCTLSQTLLRYRETVKETLQVNSDMIAGYLELLETPFLTRGKDSISKLSCLARGHLIKKIGRLQSAYVRLLNDFHLVQRELILLQRTIGSYAQKNKKISLQGVEEI